MTRIVEWVDENGVHHSYSSDLIDKFVEQIIKEIDKSTMMGAAWDCSSESWQELFKNKLRAIISGDTE